MAAHGLVSHLLSRVAARPLGAAPIPKRNDRSRVHLPNSRAILLLDRPHSPVIRDSGCGSGGGSE